MSGGWCRYSQNPSTATGSDSFWRSKCALVVLRKVEQPACIRTWTAAGKWSSLAVIRSTSLVTQEETWKERHAQGKITKSMRCWLPLDATHVVEGPWWQFEKVAGAHRLCSNKKAWRQCPVRVSFSRSWSETTSLVTDPKRLLVSPNTIKGNCGAIVDTRRPSSFHQSLKSQSVATSCGAWITSIRRLKWGARTTTISRRSMKAATWKWEVWKT